MFIQLHLEQLAILELELLAVDLRIALVDDTVVVRTYDKWCLWSRCSANW